MQKLTLNKNDIVKRRGPHVLVIIDGMCLGKENEGKSFYLARTPNLDMLMKTCPWTTSRPMASCGLPRMRWEIQRCGTMPWSRPYFDQGAKLLSKAIDSGYVVYNRSKETPVKKTN
jgi:2,3-bisphosphoglycerate-independent phosphoglycerate mutase